VDAFHPTLVFHHGTSYTSHFVLNRGSHSLLALTQEQWTRTRNFSDARLEIRTDLDRCYLHTAYFNDFGSYETDGTLCEARQTT
jgi:hypothetical protein